MLTAAWWMIVTITTWTWLCSKLSSGSSTSATSLSIKETFLPSRSNTTVPWCPTTLTGWFLLYQVYVCSMYINPVLNSIHFSNPYYIRLQHFSFVPFSNLSHSDHRYSVFVVTQPHYVVLGFDLLPLQIKITF